MEWNFYSADGGTIAILCGGSIVRFNNCYGDGSFKTYLFNDGDEFNNYKEEHKQYSNMEEKDYHFQGLHYFDNAKVLNYDCLKPNQIKDDDVLFILKGNYTIYSNNGKVYFIKG